MYPGQFMTKASLSKPIFATLRPGRKPIFAPCQHAFRHRGYPRSPLATYSPPPRLLPPHVLYRTHGRKRVFLNRINERNHTHGRTHHRKHARRKHATAILTHPGPLASRYPGPQTTSVGTAATTCTVATGAVCLISASASAATMPAATSRTPEHPPLYIYI